MRSRLARLATTAAVLVVSACGSTTTAPSGPVVTGTPVGATVRYVWTGVPGGQFTAAQFDQLAANFSLVIIEKTHGQTFADWDAAVRSIKSRNPHVLVLANFLAGIVNKTFRARWGASFQDSWLLQNSIGSVVTTKQGDSVDLSNAGYRSFVEGQVMQRMRAAPYDGVMFDNYHVPTGTSPQDLAQAQGYHALLTEMRQKLGPKRLLYFNGVSRGGDQGADIRASSQRGFDQLGTASGAQDEFFCYLDRTQTFRTAADIVADDVTYHALATTGSTILFSLKVRDQASADVIDHIKRYCYANFLMAMVPGHTLIQFKQYASEKAGPQIEDNASFEQRYPLGLPTGGVVTAGSVISRRFAGGEVAVNNGNAVAPYTVVGGGWLMSNGTRVRQLHAGDKVDVPARDAVYVVAAG